MRRLPWDMRRKGEASCRGRLFSPNRVTLAYVSFTKLPRNSVEQGACRERRFVPSLAAVDSWDGYRTSKKKRKGRGGPFRSGFLLRAGASACPRPDAGVNRSRLPLLRIFQGGGGGGGGGGGHGLFAHCSDRRWVKE